MLESESGELRGRVRIGGSFLVGVKGVDAEPVLRHGNLSTSGIYFEHPELVVDLDTVQLLTVSSTAVSVDVMARVIRCVTLSDVEFGTTRGVAFEFLPETPDIAHRLAEVCRDVLVGELSTGRDVPVDHMVSSRPAGPPDDDELHPARMGSIDVRRLVMETNWSAPVGAAIELSLGSGDGSGPVPFEGQVVGVQEVGPGAYRLEVGRLAPVNLAADSDVGTWSEQTMEHALSFLVSEPEAAREKPRHHLAGSVDRIALPPLLSLIEMEKLSGILTVTDADRTVAVYVDRGALLDAEDTGNPGESVEAIVGSLMAWSRGEFEFRVAEVARPRRVPRSITGVLLDQARRRDEQAR